MRRHSLGTLLFAIAGSCGGPPEPAKPTPVVAETKTVRKPITPELKQIIDDCAKYGDRECGRLCLDAFDLSNSTVTARMCSHKVEGDDVLVTAELVPKGTSVGNSYGNGAVDGYGAGQQQGCAPGRRPIGLACLPLDAPSAVAGYLATAAQLEAASITAFVRIHRHLVELGAPRALLERVVQAAADELAHTHAVVALARAYGVSPPPPVIAPEPPMTLVARAIDNAVEGLVGETVAALHAAFIAMRARDPEVRRVFADIVEDEAEHALLAHELHGFYARLLSRSEQRAVAVARAIAVERALSAPVSFAMRELGIPDGGVLVDATLRALGFAERRIVRARSRDV